LQQRRAKNYHFSLRARDRDGSIWSNGFIRTGTVFQAVEWDDQSWWSCQRSEN
jgi:hypothetical protein